MGKKEELGLGATEATAPSARARQAGKGRNVVRVRTGSRSRTRGVHHHAAPRAVL
jgi:hypothetical protein